MLDSTVHHRRTLVVSLASVVIALALWRAEQFSFILYPLRLFVTFIHESGHGLAAITTGGTLHGFTVSPSGIGVATTSGGWYWLIVPAGYLGAALFGAGLFFLANSVHRTRRISGGLALLVAGMALFYTQWLSTAWFVGLLSAAVLALLAWKGGRELNLAALNVLAVLCSLNAVVDLFGLVSNSGVGIGDLRNDAVVFSQTFMPIFPPWLIALSWAVIALALLALAFWYSLGQRIRDTVDQAYRDIKR